MYIILMFEHMDTIPAEYWMIIVAILVGFVCFVLYQLGALIKESKDTVAEVKKTLARIDPILNNVTDIVDTVNGTVHEVNEFVIRPIRSVSSILSVASGIMEGIKGK